MAPSLRIPVSANLDDFKKRMDDTVSLGRTAARKVAQHFLEMNKEIASSAASAVFAGAAANALRFAGQIALVIGAAKLMGDAIGAARDQLKDMVEIADKAKNLGVSGSFLQSFSAEAKKLQVEVDDLEAALQHAFNATKDKSPIDLNEWDTGKDRITEVERALRIYNATLAKAAGQQLQGLVLFRDADTQEKKIQAVLQAMVQLEGIGQKAAALDLGEKMFGSKFVDNIRQGRTSAEGLLETIRTAGLGANSIFPDALVQRAKEMDDQLKIAHQRLSTALKPSWNDLADVLLTIKGYWSDTITLIAKAVELSNQIRIPGIVGAASDDVDAKRSALAQINARLNGTGGGLTGAIDMPALDIPGLGRVIDSTKERLERWRDELQKEIAALTKGEGEGPPTKPSRGTGENPTRKPTDTGGLRDRFESGIDTIEKRTAALNAEAEAIDLGTIARERAKIVAQLETVAKQANAAAGKGENVVTEEQRKQIEEVANAYGKAADAAQRAKIMSDIKFDLATAWLTQEDVAIARALRETYPDIATGLNSVEAAGMRAANSMKSLSSIGQEINRSLFTQFGQNIRNGMNAWDSFRNAGLNALGRIADKLLEMAADNLWKGLFSNLLGGGAGGGGGLLKLLGFAEGGYTGPGGKYQPAGIVHRGEYVMPARTVQKLGVGTLDRLRGYADGGLVTPSLPTLPRTFTSGTQQPSISIGGSTVVVQGDASEKTIGLIKQALSQYDVTLPAKVVGSVRDAQKRRVLA